MIKTPQPLANVFSFISFFFFLTPFPKKSMYDIVTMVLFVLWEFGGRSYRLNWNLSFVIFSGLCFFFSFWSKVFEHISL